jgi:hypothetical protein
MKVEAASSQGTGLVEGSGETALTAPASLKINLTNVILKPAALEAWATNATEEAGEPGKAAKQSCLHFDFAKALGR